MDTLIDTTDLVDVVASSPRFDRFVTALETADLVEALRTRGPFTVFAPTDDAFEAMPDEILEGLLENPESLRAVLAYHVVPGRVSSVDAAVLDSADTLLGPVLDVAMEHGELRVDGIRVVDADLEADNGLVHAIEAVLLPPRAE